MSVIIRLQNLPWSANALDIRNFFRGLSIPEGGVHIVGGEQGDAFIAFSTDEDARQAMMLDCGKIKEIQVRLLLSSRSEMHKVIEAARQTVPILTLTAPAPAPVPAIVPTPAPVVQPVSLPAAITPFSAALGNTPLSSFGIPGIGNPNEIPQPAVIEAPPLEVSPFPENHAELEKEEDKLDRRKDRRRTRSRSRSRDRDRKDRKRDRRDRSRSRERRRRDRSRSRDRRDRKRERKDRSRSRDRSPGRRSRDRRERKSPTSQDKIVPLLENPVAPPAPSFGPTNTKIAMQMLPLTNVMVQNGPLIPDTARIPFNDPTINETLNKLQEIGKKRNPNAFQGDQNGSNQFQVNRGGYHGGRGSTFRREGRQSRFDNERVVRECCVAIRNAPTHTSYGDVRRFFPFMIDKHGIKMINDNMGRRTGNIFVRFCESRSKQLALQRKNNELKGEEVSVEALEDETYEAAVDSFLPYREENEEEDVSLIIADEEETAKPYNVLKLTELPNFIKEHDIMKAFSDFSLLSIMLSDCRITRSKTAFVQFVKPEDAKVAYERREKLLFGRRHPTLTPISTEEYEKHKQQIEKPSEPLLAAAPEPVEEITQEVNQVPRDPRQRRPQFENGPVPQNVSQTQPQNAFFGTPFPPQQAFGHQFPGQQFGFSNVPMDPRTAANWQNPHPANAMPNVPKQKPVINIEDEPLDCVLMKGFPREATDRTIVNFLSDTGAVPARIHLMLDQNGLPSGDCFCEFRSSQEARRAATKHGQNLDGCRVTVDLVPRSVVEEALEGPKQPEINDSLINNGPSFFDQNQRGGFAMRGTFRGRGFDRGNFNRGGFDHGRGNFRGRGNWNDRGGRGGFEVRGFDRGRARNAFGRGRGFENGQANPRNVGEEDKEGLENFGAPGCVVSMENVPFRASIDDIMEFFSDFELTQDDVIRRYNERGQPTGDARVAFRSPFDAQRAVHSRHMNTIHDRRINVKLL